MNLLVLDHRRYHEMVPADSDLAAAVNDWVVRIAPWALSKGLFVNSFGEAEVFASFWDGERYEVLFAAAPDVPDPDPDDLDYRFLVPPEPPPAALIRFAVPVLPPTKESPCTT